jgi:hypothetical protein
MLPKTLDQLKIRVGSVRGLSEVTNGVSNEVSNQGGRTRRAPPLKLEKYDFLA